MRLVYISQSEDVSIAIGQVLNKALGSKAGLNRMWTSSAQDGGKISIFHVAFTCYTKL